MRLAAVLALAALPALADEHSDSLTLTVTPGDAWPPEAVTDLRATAGLEGQVLLEWTAPREDSGIAFPSNDPVTAYQVRSATFSAASVASTTTWLGSASSLSGAPPPGRCTAAQAWSRLSARASRTGL